MNFSKPETTSVLEVLGAWWPMILLYALVLGIGMVCMVRRPTAPTFSLSKRRGRSSSAEEENE